MSQLHTHTTCQRLFEISSQQCIAATSWTFQNLAALTAACLLSLQDAVKKPRFASSLAILFFPTITTNNCLPRLQTQPDQTIQQTSKASANLLNPPSPSDDHQRPPHPTASWTQCHSLGVQVPATSPPTPPQKQPLPPPLSPQQLPQLPPLPSWSCTPSTSASRKPNPSPTPLRSSKPLPRLPRSLHHPRVRPKALPTNLPS